MPLGKEHYTTFAEIALVNNTADPTTHTYSPQWSKTLECDRLINLIYDEALLNGSTLTRTRRILALGEYFGIKRTMGAGWFPHASADVRLPVIFETLGRVLTRQGETQIGRCGRFHRALQAVWNETTGHIDKTAAFGTWLNNVVLQLNEDFNMTRAPVVADITAYRLNQGEVLINSGEGIDIPVDGRVDLYTNGINFLSVQWTKDGADIPGAVEENLRISPSTVADVGVYVAVYSNGSGTDTSSNEFLLVEGATNNGS